MLDHAFGRPSTTWKRIETLAVILLSLKLLSSKNNFNSKLKIFLDANLKSVRPWKTVLGTLTVFYILRNLMHLLGLNPPESMSRMYTRSFFRVTWAATALDVGFWTAMPIRWAWLRYPLSLIFSGYYLLNPEEAEYKARKYHAKSTSEIMRVAWEKGTTPLLKLAMGVFVPKIKQKQQLFLPRPLPPSRSLFKCSPNADGSLSKRDDAQLPDINAWLFFDGTKDELAQCDSLVLLFPGGGFVTMSPLDHQDHTTQWAVSTKLPILSIDYGKAPRYPYPWGLEECFDAYRAVIESNGAVIGMNTLNGDRPIKVVLAGDSAGGNFVFGVTLKIVETQMLDNPNAAVDYALPSPSGIMAVYPCLSFDMSCWISPDYIKIMKEGSARHVQSMLEDRETLNQKNPLAQPPAPRKTTHILEPDDTEFDGSAPPKSSFMASWLPKDRRKEQFERERGAAVHTNISFTSRSTYANDRILTMDSMRSMAMLYLGNSPQPPNFQSDYFLSPIVAPDSLLARFPPTVLICGEKDPLVDDTMFVAARLRDVKAKMHAEFLRYLRKFAPDKVPTEFAYHAFQRHANDMVHVKILEGMSHAFLNYLPLLGEKKELLSLTSGWLTRLFHFEPNHPEYSLDHTLSQTYRSMTDTMIANAMASGAISPTVCPHPYEQVFSSPASEHDKDGGALQQIDASSMSSLAFYGGGAIPSTSPGSSKFSLPSPSAIFNTLIPEKVVQVATAAVQRHLSLTETGSMGESATVESLGASPSSDKENQCSDSTHYRRKSTMRRESSYSSISAVLAHSSSFENRVTHSMSNSLDQMIDQLDKRRQTIADNVYDDSSSKGTGKKWRS